MQPSVWLRTDEAPSSSAGADSSVGDEFGPGGAGLWPRCPLRSTLMATLTVWRHDATRVVPVLSAGR
jgi:hypothetical protein